MRKSPLLLLLLLVSCSTTSRLPVWGRGMG